MKLEPFGWTEKSLRRRAASALDATHACGERGPRTLGARSRLAAWLDGRLTYKARHPVTSACAWLEYVAWCERESSAVPS
jgi:hypothetical protein